MENYIKEKLAKYSANPEPKKMATALVVKPGELPCVKEIGTDYKSLFCLVEGPFEGFTLDYDGVDILCNQYGKVLGLPSNRAILDSEGNPCDVIAGTFIVIGAPEDSEEYRSLTTKEIQKYYKLFWNPVCRWRYVL